MNNEQFHGGSESNEQPYVYGQELHRDQMFPDDDVLPAGVSRERFGERAEEIGYLVQLANFVDELVNHPDYGRHHGVDAATDYLGMYGRQIAVNDPAHARNLVEALEWPGNRDAAFYVARDIRRQLGLPPLELDDRGFAG